MTNSEKDGEQTIYNEARKSENRKNVLNIQYAYLYIYLYIYFYIYLYIYMYTYMTVHIKYTYYKKQNCQDSDHSRLHFIRCSMRPSQPAPIQFEGREPLTSGLRNVEMQLAI